MYLICDWDIDFSINSWGIRKQDERQISQKRSVKANWDEKKGKRKKRSCKKRLLGERTHSLANCEWSYTTVLWESKELIPFDIEFCPIFSLKHSIAQRYTIHSCIGVFQLWASWTNHRRLRRNHFYLMIQNISQ